MVGKAGLWHSKVHSHLTYDVQSAFSGCTGTSRIWRCCCSTR